MVEHKVELLDSGRCCQWDSLVSECTVVAGALGAVSVQIQSDFRTSSVDRLGVHMVAVEVQPTRQSLDTVAWIQPCPFPS